MLMDFKEYRKLTHGRRLIYNKIITVQAGAVKNKPFCAADDADDCQAAERGDVYGENGAMEMSGGSGDFYDMDSSGNGIWSVGCLPGTPAF